MSSNEHRLFKLLEARRAQEAHIASRLAIATTPMMRAVRLAAILTAGRDAPGKPEQVRRRNRIIDLLDIVASRKGLADQFQDIA